MYRKERTLANIHKKQSIRRHEEFLTQLSELLGKKQDGKSLFLKLRALEVSSNRAATNYCNGENGMNSTKWELECNRLIKKVKEVFECEEIPGLFINGDARGYTLKIEDEAVRALYPNTLNFYKDWGGYGILAPDFE